MVIKPHVHVSDLRGYSRLAIAATLGVTDLVEAVHSTILRTPHIFGQPVHGRTPGITGLVYHSIRGVTRLVGTSIDALLALLDAAFEPTASTAGARGRFGSGERGAGRLPGGR